MGVLALAPGCSADPGSLTGGANPYAGDPGGGAADDDDDGPIGLPEPPPSRDNTFGDKTLYRARLWIDAKMPYCGGPNGGKDLICGGTCERTGRAKKAEWDDYRTDCSGFVSWAWELPPPGRTTRTLAPTDTSVSAVITIADLLPGDALNGGGHAMIFGGWADAESTAIGTERTALILQESRCGTTAHEKTMEFKIADATTLQVIADGRKFRAIRFKAK
ncbi:MAG: hypothetical protein KF819_24955 [Labilithrix sp.]|nr:hypothetical protein [Labilithrix sp.]